MKRCTKTMSGKHYFPEKEWCILGEKIENNQIVFICGYNHVACKYCGLIDDLPKRKGK